MFQFVKLKQISDLCSAALLHKWELDGTLSDSVATNNNPLLSNGSTLWKYDDFT